MEFRQCRLKSRCGRVCVGGDAGSTGTRKCTLVFLTLLLHVLGDDKISLFLLPLNHGAFAGT